MTSDRRAFALPAALAALVVLSAVAALANIAARVSLRESAALTAEAQTRAARAALRARASIALARESRVVLLAVATPIGERDTALAVSALAWPWHRVMAVVGGLPVIAEFARGIAPAVPWCSATVAGGTAIIAPGAVALDPASACAVASRTETPLAIAAFADSLAIDLAGAPVGDSVTVFAGVAPAFVSARRRVEVASGAFVSGLVIAPSIIVQPGAVVRGILIAAETLRISAGASVIADEHAAQDALRAQSKLRLLGRAGLLLPP